MCVPSQVLKVRAQTRVGEGEKRLEIGGEFDMKFRKPQAGHPLIQHCRGWYIESGAFFSRSSLLLLLLRMKC